MLTLREFIFFCFFPKVKFGVLFYPFLFGFTYMCSFCIWNFINIKYTHICKYIYINIYVYMYKQYININTHI